MDLSKKCGCPFFDSVNHQCLACDVSYTLADGDRVSNCGYSTFKKTVSCQGNREHCEA